MIGNRQASTPLSQASASALIAGGSLLLEGREGKYKPTGAVDRGEVRSYPNNLVWSVATTTYSSSGEICWMFSAARLSCVNTVASCSPGLGLRYRLASIDGTVHAHFARGGKGGKGWVADNQVKRRCGRQLSAIVEHMKLTFLSSAHADIRCRWRFRASERRRCSTS